MDKTPQMNENDEQRVAWFREAGLGMFIHWGLYSVLGHGEWALWREDIHPRDYAKLAEKFHPENFNAHIWAQLACDSGAKYVVLNTRHHDGFALWDSRVSDYTSAKTAAQRDFVAEYVKAVRQAGLKVGLYYSPLDWSWAAFHLQLPDDRPATWQSFSVKGPDDDPKDWDTFVNYVHQQVRELMTDYGKIDVLFYDGCWYQSAEQWKSRELNQMVRTLQPDIVINNRSGLPEDYDTPENEIPLNIQPQQRPWETCYCMNDTWGYIPGDENYKNARQCLHALLRVRSAGGNLVLNTSPQADGSMPAPAVTILQQLGRWLKTNGESVYGCGLAEMCPHGTGFFSQPGIVTANSDTCSVYYHILRWLGKNEHCVKVNAQVTSARRLADNQEVTFHQNGNMIYFADLPAQAPDSLDTVIKLNYQPGSAKSAWTNTYV